MENTWTENVEVWLSNCPLARASAMSLSAVFLAVWKALEDEMFVTGGYAGPRIGQFCAAEKPMMAPRKTRGLNMTTMAPKDSPDNSRALKKVKVV